MLTRRLYVRLRWRWYDLWIGFYIDNQNHRTFICPLPTLVIEIGRVYEHSLAAAILDGANKAFPDADT